MPTASCPFTGHHREEPGSIVFAPSLQVFVHTEKIPLSLLFSRLNCPSCPSLSSHDRCSNPFMNFLAFHGTHSSLSVSLGLGIPELDPTLWMDLPSTEQGGTITSLVLLATLCLVQPSVLLNTKGHF